jgi:NCS1 family nucleobase:cation symporter-1
MTTAPSSAAAPPAPAYGDKVIAVEAAGAEPIPLAERHGSPVHLLWTWSSPNIEFATVFIGVLPVLAFGLTFWQAAAAIVLGTAVGSVAHAALSTDGPRFGVPQMVVGRLSFGHRGNALPAALNALMAGIGWFAVNSVSAAFALNTLTGLRPLPGLFVVVAAQIVIGFIGHNFVHAFERYTFPLLGVVFLLAAVFTFAKADLSGSAAAHGGIGGFLLAFSTAFGYAAGWNPYAAGYSRYLPPGTSRRRVALFPGLGLFLSISFIALIGTASATIAGPTAAALTAVPRSMSWTARIGSRPLAGRTGTATRARFSPPTVADSMPPPSRAPRAAIPTTRCPAPTRKPARAHRAARSCLPRIRPPTRSPSRAAACLDRSGRATVPAASPRVTIAVLAASVIRTNGTT